MQDLDGGLAVEAGVDFTGGIPEVINLEARTDDEEKRLFSLLKGVDRKKDERFLSSSLAGPSGMGLEARQVKIKESISYIQRHCLLVFLKHTFQFDSCVQARLLHHGLLPTAPEGRDQGALGSSEESSRERGRVERCLEGHR